MTELALIKHQSGLLAPSGEGDAEILERWKKGEVIRVKAARMRKGWRHRKFFTLLDVGFEAWEPPDESCNGMPVQKNRERFRKDIIIATGRYDVVLGIDGTAKLEAKSMSFSSMDDLEFEQLYSDTVNVILEKILTHYTREDLDERVQRVLDLSW